MTTNNQQIVRIYFQQVISQMLSQQVKEVEKQAKVEDKSINCLVDLSCRGFDALM